MVDDYRESSCSISSNSTSRRANAYRIKGAKGHCAEWANLVMNEISEIQNFKPYDEDVRFLEDNGIAIAVHPIALDYNGINPKFSSHVILSLEIGEVGDRSYGGLGRGKIYGLMYFDNGLYGNINDNDKIINFCHLSDGTLFPYHKDPTTLNFNLPDPITQLPVKDSIFNWR